MLVSSLRSMSDPVALHALLHMFKRPQQWSCAQQCSAKCSSCNTNTHSVTNSSTSACLATDSSDHNIANPAAHAGSGSFVVFCWDAVCTPVWPVRWQELEGYQVLQWPGYLQGHRSVLQPMCRQHRFRFQNGCEEGRANCQFIILSQASHASLVFDIDAGCRRGVPCLFHARGAGCAHAPPR